MRGSEGKSRNPRCGVPRDLTPGRMRRRAAATPRTRARTRSPAGQPDSRTRTRTRGAFLGDPGVPTPCATEYARSHAAGLAKVRSAPHRSDATSKSRRTLTVVRLTVRAPPKSHRPRAPVSRRGPTLRLPAANARSRWLLCHEAARLSALAGRTAQGPKRLGLQTLL